MIRFFSLVLMIGFSLSVANAAQVGDYLRDQEGNVLTELTQPEAIKLCSEKGTRLPTLRELMAFASQYGLKIFSEDMSTEDLLAKYPEEQFAHTLFWASTINNGVLDQFHYSTKNYNFNNENPKVLWSSTGDYSAYHYILFGKEIKEHAYYFNERTGYMDYANKTESRWTVGSARCTSAN